MSTVEHESKRRWMKPTRISGVLVVLGLLLLAAKFVVTATMTGSGPPQNAIETRNAQSDEAVQAQGLHTNDTVRQVWEAGVNPFGEISTSIYWVDNSTLLFSARNGPKPVSLQDAGRIAARRSIYGSLVNRRDRLVITRKRASTGEPAGSSAIGKARSIPKTERRRKCGWWGRPEASGKPRSQKREAGAP
jgi:hypothetical protein